MSDIQALENHIENLRDLVEKRQMALRLSENPDFRKLYIEGFCHNDAARLIQLSTDPRMEPKIQESCLAEARAAGFVKRYITDIIQMGHRAEADLKDSLVELEELRAELHE